MRRWDGPTADSERNRRRCGSWTACAPRASPSAWRSVTVELGGGSSATIAAYVRAPGAGRRTARAPPRCWPPGRSSRRWPSRPTRSGRPCSKRTQLSGAEHDEAVQAGSRCRPPGQRGAAGRDPAADATRSRSLRRRTACCANRSKVTTNERSGDARSSRTCRRATAGEQATPAAGAPDQTCKQQGAAPVRNGGKNPS